MVNAKIPPRVAAIHDLSCIGRCALTAVIPTLSALGVQAVPVPTAVLSTQTDGYEDLFFRDMSEEMDAITDHFERLGIKFDAIYSGFLGSRDQIGRVVRFIEHLRPLGPVLVDPVMGDDGALYQTYTEDLVAGMRTLCRHAHIITPNFTEACLLTGMAYRSTEGMEEAQVYALCDELARKLHAMGPRRVVITGIDLGDVVRTVAYDRGERFVCDRKKLSARYPGTGDIFASVLLGNLLSDVPFADAVRNACRFVSHAISYTLSAPPSPRREGVLLEGCLGELMGL